MERDRIELTLEATDIPDVPGGLPIKAYVSVVGDALQIKAERVGSIGGDVTFEFELPKTDIKTVTIKFVKDAPDDFQYSPWNQPELSTAIVLHRDPYEVVPHFRTTFSSTKSYWIKALQKMLSDKLGIESEEVKT